MTRRSKKWRCSRLLPSGAARCGWAPSYFWAPFSASAFSCAMPLASFAAVGALTLRRHDALVLIGAVWLANQTTGFTLLHYPLERTALAWGGALGAVALLATFAAHWVEGRLLQKNRLISSSAAFLAAFAAYEGALFAISANKRKWPVEFCSRDRPAHFPHKCRCLRGTFPRAPRYGCWGLGR
jgi:hypothetical protein